MLHAHIWISFSNLSPACTCSFRALSSGLKKEEKNTLPAAMQPQNFRKAINGQAVDSYSGFLSSHSWKGGLPDLRVSDAELQRCGRKVCACMQCAVCVILWPPSVCRKALRLTDCKVGVVILPDSISPFLSPPVTFKCLLYLVAVALVYHNTVFYLIANTCLPSALTLAER